MAARSETRKSLRTRQGVAAPPDGSGRAGVHQVSNARILLIVFIGLTVLVGGFLYGSYRSDMDAAYARIASGSELLDTPCGPIESNFSRWC